ncbi:MAG: hypothetical protein R3E39_06825 [Anaerolineae bacterium]
MSELRYDPAYKARMNELQFAVPGMKGEKAFGCPAYKVNDKFFAFVRRQEVALKLPIMRVAQFIAKNPDVMVAFQPGRGIAWKQWVSIRRHNASGYEQDLPLIDEAIEFVLGNAYASGRTQF